MTALRSAESIEYVAVLVAGTADAAAVDPTADTVAMAFLDRFTAPTADTEWITAAWHTDTTDPANPLYYARLLVGPGADYVPTPGTRVDVWVRVTDNPEAPVVRSGGIQFV